MLKNLTPRSRPTGFSFTLLTLLPLAFMAPTAVAAQSASETYYKAYYLQHETDQLAKAMELYTECLGQLPRNHELAGAAKAAIQELQEDLFCSDLSRLMPPSTILYAELARPGQQLRSLTEKLGLLAEGSDLGTMGLSPKLFDSALNLRGAAVAVTSIDPNGGPPSGVIVLHPGDQDSVRGMIETVIGNGALPTEPIAGAFTWSIEDQLFITRTERLWVASPERSEIEGVIERLQGKRNDSFSGTESLERARELGEDNLLFFHLRAEPVLPQIQALLEQEAKRDPQVAVAMSFFDIDSLVGVTGRLGVDDEGLGLNVGLDLAEGHRNLAFNLLRLPSLKPSTLEHIPAGASFVLAGALNEKANVAPIGGNSDQPIVTALDFGREIFGNVIDASVFGLPGEKISLIPEVAISLRVNDASRSRALWNFALGLAKQGSGARDMTPKLITVAGHKAEQYNIGPVPLIVLMNKGELLISPSRSLIERTMEARANGQTALKDPLLEGHIRALGDGTNLALIASPARLMKMARFYVPSDKKDKVRAMSELLSDTVVRVGLKQTNTHLGLQVKVANLPNVSPLLAQLRAQRHGQGVATAAGTSAPVARAKSAESFERKRAERRTRAKAKREERKGRGTSGAATQTAKYSSPQDLRESFDRAVDKRDLDQALQSLGELAVALDEDAMELNNLAWALLTESAYDGKFNEAARKLSVTCDRLTKGENWMFLDTYALAEFEMGNVQRAIELGKKAYELAGNSGRENEVMENLKRFKAAASGKQASGAIGTN